MTVNSNNDVDDGVCNATHCSLREAINKANSLSGSVTIGFNIDGGGTQTIQPASGLPTLAKPMTIDGSTQHGYTSKPLIELDGSLAATKGGGGFFDGLVIQGGQTTIRALAINRFPGNGIRLVGAGGNKIEGCVIGTDPSGIGAAGNGTGGGQSAGILIEHGKSNVVGGTGKHAGNLISGNLDAGIRILSNSNLVLSNLIGTNAGGTAPLANQGNEILVAGGMNQIGGGSVATRNVVSGNLKNGVALSGATNDVKGNLIGLDAAGAAAVPNHENGVFVGANLTRIGGSAAGEGNIISGNFIDGIQINADSVEVVGNFIGTDVHGTAAVGNARNGVFIMSQGGVLIGGTDSGAMNVISGNGIVGVWIEDGSNNVTVYGNRIGTNAAGTAALKNVKSGMHVSGTNQRIGSSEWGAGNLISGNGGAGISVVSPATEIKIQNNMIGTDHSGTAALGNDIGIEIGLSNGAYSVLIGGSLYGEGNLISGNHQEGLLLYNNAQVYGNRIGMDQGGENELPNGADGILIKGDNNQIGTPHDPNSIAHNGRHGVAVITESGSAAENTISGNSIWDNSGLGIALAGDAVLANDPGDADAGDNNQQNYPLMTSAIHDPVAGQTTVSATLDSAPSALYMVEFFVNTVCNPTGYGEGEQMVAYKTVTTNASGHGDVAVSFEPYHFIPGGFITATATDTSGNTSEFSNCVPVTQAPTPTPAPTSGGMQFKPTVNPAAFFFGGCTPDRVAIGVEAISPLEAIAYMQLYVRLVDKKSGVAGAWSKGLSMAQPGPTTFLFTLTLDKLADYDKFTDAWLQYQFVAYNKAQKEIGRSDVFGDVSFGRCGRTVPGRTPTAVGAR